MTKKQALFIFTSLLVLLSVSNTAASDRLNGLDLVEGCGNFHLFITNKDYTKVLLVDGTDAGELVQESRKGEYEINRGWTVSNSPVGITYYEGRDLIHLNRCSDQVFTGEAEIHQTYTLDDGAVFINIKPRVLFGQKQPWKASPTVSVQLRKVTFKNERGIEFIIGTFTVEDVRVPWKRVRK